MTNTDFFDSPILNSPYHYPKRHWELDAEGQPTRKIIEYRRTAQFITPIPKPKKQRGRAKQQSMILQDSEGISSKQQKYQDASTINAIRKAVDAWRASPSTHWFVTAETERLLRHWRNHAFASIRPFFCQVEAVETAIWLTEVAPQTAGGRALLARLGESSEDANPGLLRWALKLATGAGKTTVMAMLIAWQTVNAVRHPKAQKFTRGFLVVAPGVTIRDRLRVLSPNDPDSYYQSRELVPTDMLPDLQKAKIVITNYHAFGLRERVDLSSGGRDLLRGRGEHREELNTKETEGQMLQRVLPELMAFKNILVLNDEAHHCYREKPAQSDSDEDGETIGDLKGDDKAEAEAELQTARLWISGLEAVQRRLGLLRIIDLSATPFFLRGSGYAEGTLFPWTVSDFSLMDAIECGIVKLPRVPVADNTTGEMPRFRNLWENIRDKMPKRKRAGDQLDPLSLPVELQTALDALYGHYQKTFDLWQEHKIGVPPCFIIVCNNTSTSKLVYDYVSGHKQIITQAGTQNAAEEIFHNGRLPLFRNFDDDGKPIARPRTLLIDSRELESGEKLSDDFRKMAAPEIERFRREYLERTGDQKGADNLEDRDILREAMNTVGKVGRLGESIRCVVSVAMLTEGWDANTVTHVLGIRAFSTQLLCEQVIGRALRRQSYDVDEAGMFRVEYADVFGIPFDFTAKPSIVKPQKPRATIHVHAVKPEQDACEISFPRVVGYRNELPDELWEAVFTEDSQLVITPELVGPSITQNAAIVGESVDFTLENLANVRKATIIFHITKRLIFNKFRDANEEPKLHLFGQLKRFAEQWFDQYLVCKGQTYPGQLLYQGLMDMACERIYAALLCTPNDTRTHIKALLDPYNPTGSTAYVNFNTSKESRWQADPRKCHINWIILDSDWEAEFCRVAEAHPRVKAYVKNQNLGFEVPYQYGSVARTYLPDFIVLVDDGRGADDLLHLVVEIKGLRREDAKDKSNAMQRYWVPGVNNLGTYGRWAFVEFRDVFEMQSDFGDKIQSIFDEFSAKTK